MKMKNLRRLRTALAAPPGRAVTIVPRKVRAQFDVSDATMEPEAGPAPEAVFDRLTGPYGRRTSYGFDEET